MNETQKEEFLASEESKMNETQKEQFLAHLESKWLKPQKCTICKNTNWTVQPDLYELRQFTAGSLILGRPLIPLVAVECKNCGHVVLFNAIRAGLVIPEEKKGESPPPEKKHE